MTSIARNGIISHLQDEVAYLRDENRRKDEIIMQQAMTMRALGSPTPETTRDEQNDGQGEPGPGPEGGPQHPGTGRRQFCASSVLVALAEG